MNDLANFKKMQNKKKCIHNFPDGILNVIQMYYPEKYLLMLQDRTQTTTLFSKEEWIDIMTKSRNSYRSHIHRMNLRRKYSGQGNQAEIS